MSAVTDARPAAHLATTPCNFQARHAGGALFVWTGAIASACVPYSTTSSSNGHIAISPGFFFTSIDGFLTNPYAYKAVMYSSPPAYRPFREIKPTLLVAWWITIFCTCLTLLRLAGRYVRVERLFLEDKIMALSLVPMYLRMACAHVVLLYGTNNVEQPALSDTDLHDRQTGSRLVLASRVFYAATYVPFRFMACS